MAVTEASDAFARGVRGEAEVRDGEAVGGGDGGEE